MRGVDANSFVSWLSSNWMWVAAASFLGLMMFRRRGHHRSVGYGNCGTSGRVIARPISIMHSRGDHTGCQVGAYNRASQIRADGSNRTSQSDSFAFALRVPVAGIRLAAARSALTAIRKMRTTKSSRSGRVVFSRAICAATFVAACTRVGAVRDLATPPFASQLCR